MTLARVLVISSPTFRLLLPPPDPRLLRNPLPRPRPRTRMRHQCRGPRKLHLAANTAFRRRRLHRWRRCSGSPPRCTGSFRKARAREASRTCRLRCNSAARRTGWWRCTWRFRTSPSRRPFDRHRPRTVPCFRREGRPGRTSGRACCLARSSRSRPCPGCYTPGTRRRTRCCSKSHPHSARSCNRWRHRSCALRAACLRTS